MRMRIAVTDPLPVFCKGVMEILREAGYEPEAPDNLLAWIRDEQTKAVIMTVRSEADWQLMETLHRSTTDVLLVALLDQMSVAASVRALRAGAVCVVSRDTSPTALSEAFSAAVRGQSLVPVEVLRALALSTDKSPVNEPSAEERRWLRELAAGMTVARLADEAGYSERMMFRRLRDLYSRLGVDSRTAALIEAQTQGWL